MNFPFPRSQKRARRWLSSARDPRAWQRPMISPWRDMRSPSLKPSRNPEACCVMPFLNIVFPKRYWRKEINYIQRLGVEIKTGVQVGKDISLADHPERLPGRFHRSGRPGRHEIEKERDRTFRESPMESEFLQAVNLGEKVQVGKKVAVIGGGNTAIDCARTAKRLGGEEVRIVYRRSRAEMPAAEEEIEAMEKRRGQDRLSDTCPNDSSPRDGKLSGMECIGMTLGEPDASGRRRPIPVPGSEVHRCRWIR